jgi:hypothetical protein
MWYGMRFNRPLLTWRSIFALFVCTDEKKKHGKDGEKGWRNHIKDPPDNKPHETGVPAQSVLEIFYDGCVTREP